MDLTTKRKLLIEYLLLKVDESDWHGVADCAMDLRELEVEQRLQIKVDWGKGESYTDTGKRLMEKK